MVYTRISPTKTMSPEEISLEHERLLLKIRLAHATPL
jgi:hypothetical protein